MSQTAKEIAKKSFDLRLVEESNEIVSHIRGERIIRYSNSIRIVETE